MIKNVYQSILNIGIDANISIDDVKKIKILNGIAFFGGLILFFMSIFLFILGYPYEKPNINLLSNYFFSTGMLKYTARINLKFIIPLFDLFLSFTCFLTLFLNYKRKISLAIILFCIASTLASIFIYFITGILAVFFIFISGVLPLIFYKKNKLYLFFSVINFIAFLFISLILYKNGNISVTAHAFANPAKTLIINFSIAFLLLFLIVNHFKKENLINEEKLQNSNKLLQAQSNEIQFQITHARKIQEHLLPQKDPYEYIYSFYKPMDNVGGDFYDYIHFRNSKKIGIFISDVSGHGVHAAFITSMIKTTIHQSGLHKNDPAKLLYYLNDILDDLTAGNFITAFYGIYDPLSREFLYSNAGHSHPYIISDKSVYQLNCPGSPAIAMFSNNTLYKANKQFENFEEILPANSKLLLYTDGLVESCPIDDDTFFEDANMEKIFLQYSNNKCNIFINNLMKELYIFRKSDKFEDDICLICLDV